MKRGTSSIRPREEQALKGAWHTQPARMFCHSSVGSGCGPTLDPVVDGAQLAYGHAALLEAIATERQPCRQSARPAATNDDLSRGGAGSGQPAARGGVELADIFGAYGESYRRHHPLPVSHLKVMQAVERCRTAALGGLIRVLFACSKNE